MTSRTKDKDCKELNNTDSKGGGFQDQRDDLVYDGHLTRDNLMVISLSKSIQRNNHTASYPEWSDQWVYGKYVITKYAKSLSVISRQPLPAHQQGE
jgi:hypothetical protein